MTAKEYLRQYEEAERLCRRLKMDYLKEADLADAVRSVSDNDGMPHGNGISKPTEERAIRLSEKWSVYQEAKREARETRTQLLGTINVVGGDASDVLYERYINLQRDAETGMIRLKTWDEVAKAVGFSRRQCFNLEQQGLEIISRM